MHGEEATQQAMAASETLYGTGVETLDAAAVEALVAQGVATTDVPAAQLEAGWAYSTRPSRPGWPRARAKPAGWWRRAGCM